MPPAPLVSDWSTTVEELTVNDYARINALYAEENKQLGMVVKELQIRLSNAQAALDAKDDINTEGLDETTTG